MGGMLSAPRIEVDSHDSDSSDTDSYDSDNQTQPVSLFASTFASFQAQHELQGKAVRAQQQILSGNAVQLHEMCEQDRVMYGNIEELQGQIRHMEKICDQNKEIEKMTDVTRDMRRRVRETIRDLTEKIKAIAKEIEELRSKQQEREKRLSGLHAKAEQSARKVAELTGRLAEMREELRARMRSPFVDPSELREAIQWLRAQGIVSVEASEAEILASDTCYSASGDQVPSMEELHHEKVRRDLMESFKPKNKEFAETREESVDGEQC